MTDYPKPEEWGVAHDSPAEFRMSKRIEALEAHLAHAREAMQAVVDADEVECKLRWNGYESHAPDCHCPVCVCRHALSATGGVKG